MVSYVRDTYVDRDYSRTSRLCCNYEARSVPSRCSNSKSTQWAQLNSAAHQQRRSRWMLLKLGARRRHVVSYTLRPLYPLSHWIGEFVAREVCRLWLGADAVWLYKCVWIGREALRSATQDGAPSGRTATRAVSWQCLSLVLWCGSSLAISVASRDVRYWVLVSSGRLQCGTVMLCGVVSIYILCPKH